jgi:hypothetical protein
MSAAGAKYLFINPSVLLREVNRPVKDVLPEGIDAFLTGTQILLTPESLKFGGCDLSPSPLPCAVGFLPDLPTVPGTAKPVKSRLQ